MRKTLKILLVALLPLCVEAISVALGWGHSCALLTDGRVMCWGYNHMGQLGDGTITHHSSPVEVSGLPFPGISIALGYYHTCAVLADTKVMCWGYNGQGQLGDASTSSRILPVKVSGLTNAQSMALGVSQSCALLTDGKVMCWGSSYGTTPVEVSGITTATGIALGVSQSCALLTDGKVMCWGSSYGTTPVEVSGITTATGIAVGSYSCALLTDGKVMCWGGSYGTIPVEVSGITTATGIAVGSYSCALLTDGKVMCWGGSYGTTPVEVSGITTATAIALTGGYPGSGMTGYSRSCALLTDGRVLCWGFNGDDFTPYPDMRGSILLGDIAFTSEYSSTPLEVTGIATATGIALGGTHSCALLNDGKVMCWGTNGFGQLGDMTTTKRLLSVEVLGLTSPPPPPPLTTICSLPPPPPCLCSGEYAVDESVSLAAKFSALVAIVLPSIIMSFL